MRQWWFCQDLHVYMQTVKLGFLTITFDLFFGQCIFKRCISLRKKSNSLSSVKPGTLVVIFSPVP